MKTKTRLLIGAGVMLTGASSWAQPTIASELERGVELLESGETLGKAKAHLEMVIHRKKESDRLAAEAYYYLAKCHLALDEKEKAQSCVAQLREGWPADNAWVVRAGKLPLREGIFSKAPWESGELLTYGMEVTHEGKQVHAGKFFSLIMAGAKAWNRRPDPFAENPFGLNFFGEEIEEKWTVWGGTVGDLTQLIFGGDDYRPYHGRFVSALHGDQVMDTSEEGELSLRPFGVDRPTAKFPTGGNKSVVYHYLQVMELVRVLPNELGRSYAFPLTPIEENGEVTSPTITATKEVEIEVPAGRFTCVVYEIDSGNPQANQTYWVEKGNQRRIVKLNFGDIMTSSLLSSQKDWKLDQSHLFKAGDLQLKVPGGLVAIAEPGGRSAPLLDWFEGDQVGLYDTKLRVWGGLLACASMPEDQTAEMEAVGLDAIEPMVEMMKETLSVGPMGPAEIQEIKAARKVIEDNGDTSVVTRIEIKGATLKHERTILLTVEDGAVFMCHFDHETGAGDAAIALLKEIRSSL